MGDAMAAVIEAAANADHYLVSANGKLGDSPRSAITEVARILESAQGQQPDEGLVIHFHGGLTSRPYALDKIVLPLTATYKAALSYPLFFVWESGLVESLVNNKDELSRDPAFRELVKKVTEWVLKKVSLNPDITFKGSEGQDIDDIYRLRQEFDQWFDGKTREPPVPDSQVSSGPTVLNTRASTVTVDSLADDIVDEIDDDPAFKKTMQEAYNATLSERQVQTRAQGTKQKASILLLSEEAKEELFSEPADGAGGAVKERGVFSWIAIARFTAKIVMATIKRFRAGTDHGVYCTVVEEVLRSAYGNLLGAGIWNGMKKDTADSFAAGPDVCGTQVIAKLRELEQAGRPFKRINLVGHSTGAIYICNFLDAAKAAGLESPLRCVFLAPAVTYARFAKAIDQHRNDGLAQFRMFAMRDDRESADRMLGVIYTRSLLYLVSGLLEGEEVDNGFNSRIDMPIVGMERYLTSAASQVDPHVAKVLGFLSEKPNRTVWSYSMGQSPGLNSDARRHGDFDNDPATLESVVAFIREP
jgi:hypothetical protein